jgi:hypothetical protein
MIDMGAFFEPPRKLNVKRWAVMKVLADFGLKFNTKTARFTFKTEFCRRKIRALQM